jgi:hypothetical protein
MKFDDAPAAAWAWMAEHAFLTTNPSEHYLIYWGNAYESLGSSTEPALTNNVIVATLAGLLFSNSRRHGFTTATIHDVLESFSKLHLDGSMPEKRLAALELISRVYLEGKFEHLNAADRLSIETALNGLKRRNQLEALTDPPRPNDPEMPAAGMAPILLARAEKVLRPLLGESTWSKLSMTARSQFEHGEFHYLVASQFEGERGDFTGFALCYSKGLLYEIQESLKGPLRKDPSLKDEFYMRFGGTNHPEWGQIIRFIDDLDAYHGSKLVRELLTQRVALDRLATLRAPFQKMQACRNKAVHTKDRIDREEAVMLHVLLINDGLIRRVVESFPKAPRR